MGDNYCVVGSGTSNLPMATGKICNTYQQAKPGKIIAEKVECDELVVGGTSVPVLVMQTVGREIRLAHAALKSENFMQVVVKPGEWKYLQINEPSEVNVHAEAAEPFVTFDWTVAIPIAVYALLRWVARMIKIGEIAQRYRR